MVGTGRSKGSLNSEKGLEILRENIENIKKGINCSIWAVSSWLVVFFIPLEKEI